MKITVHIRKRKEERKEVFYAHIVSVRFTGYFYSHVCLQSNKLGKGIVSKKIEYMRKIHGTA